MAGDTESLWQERTVDIESDIDIAEESCFVLDEGCQVHTRFRPSQAGRNVPACPSYRGSTSTAGRGPAIPIPSLPVGELTAGTVNHDIDLEEGHVQTNRCSNDAWVVRLITPLGKHKEWCASDGWRTQRDKDQQYGQQVRSMEEGSEWADDIGSTNEDLMVPCFSAVPEVERPERVFPPCLPMSVSGGSENNPSNGIKSPSSKMSRSARGSGTKQREGLFFGCTDGRNRRRNGVGEDTRERGGPSLFAVCPTHSKRAPEESAFLSMKGDTVFWNPPSFSLSQSIFECLGVLILVFVVFAAARLGSLISHSWTEGEPAVLLSVVVVGTGLTGVCSWGLVVPWIETLVLSAAQVLVSVLFSLMLVSKTWTATNPGGAALILVLCPLFSLTASLSIVLLVALGINNEHEDPRNIGRRRLALPFAWLRLNSERAMQICKHAFLLQAQLLSITAVLSAAVAISGENLEETDGDFSFDRTVWGFVVAHMILIILATVSNPLASSLPGCNSVNWEGALFGRERGDADVPAYRLMKPPWFSVRLPADAAQMLSASALLYAYAAPRLRWGNPLSFGFAAVLAFCHWVICVLRALWGGQSAPAEGPRRRNLHNLGVDDSSEASSSDRGLLTVGGREGSVGKTVEMPLCAAVPWLVWRLDRSGAPESDVPPLQRHHSGSAATAPAETASMRGSGGGNREIGEVRLTGVMGRGRRRWGSSSSRERESSVEGGSVVRTLERRLLNEDLRGELLGGQLIVDFAFFCGVGVSMGTLEGLEEALSFGLTAGLMLVVVFALFLLTVFVRRRVVYYAEPGKASPRKEKTDDDACSPPMGLVTPPSPSEFSSPLPSPPPPIMLIEADHEAPDPESDEEEEEHEGQSDGLNNFSSTQHVIPEVPRHYPASSQFHFQLDDLPPVPASRMESPRGPAETDQDQAHEETFTGSMPESPRHELGRLKTVERQDSQREQEKEKENDSVCDGAPSEVSEADQIVALAVFAAVSSRGAAALPGRKMSSTHSMPFPPPPDCPPPWSPPGALPSSSSIAEEASKASPSRSATSRSHSCSQSALPFVGKYTKAVSSSGVVTTEVLRLSTGLPTLPPYPLFPEDCRRFSREAEETGLGRQVLVREITCGDAPEDPADVPSQAEEYQNVNSIGSFPGGTERERGRERNSNEAELDETSSASDWRVRLSGCLSGSPGGFAAGLLKMKPKEPTPDLAVATLTGPEGDDISSEAGASPIDPHHLPPGPALSCVGGWSLQTAIEGAEREEAEGRALATLCWGVLFPQGGPGKPTCVSANWRLARLKAAAWRVSGPTGVLLAGTRIIWQLLRFAFPLLVIFLPMGLLVIF
uniref:Transmembrane protein n=1 Tax=Chromera velia CCMP2878 TaxID=1169474 RepID=A0A0G4FS67_9ALVE|eukprot:Cvel_18340.t1-p1 / transcript=Cvel_18340.t1 / gene=Cvel_18340 / organism=Chromera_velia_CCMP2878 / gene_product=hypothetical protein / transcript_product=hypothetical protein / location=Cvel_scaffold1514:34775-40425(+) / protein_length=1332 / sequence_SO=supercontig / SO=protein_coding / is_pseudo=false